MDALFDTEKGPGEQLVVGLPFLWGDAWAYLRGSFDIGRVFLHQWSVNLRFLPQEVCKASPSKSANAPPQSLLICLSHMAGFVQLTRRWPVRPLFPLLVRLFESLVIDPTVQEEDCIGCTACKSITLPSQHIKGIEQVRPVAQHPAIHSVRHTRQ